MAGRAGQARPAALRPSRSTGEDSATTGVFSTLSRTVDTDKPWPVTVTAHFAMARNHADVRARPSDSLAPSANGGMSAVEKAARFGTADGPPPPPCRSGPGRRRSRGHRRRRRHPRRCDVRGARRDGQHLPPRAPPLDRGWSTSRRPMRTATSSCRTASSSRPRSTSSCRSIRRCCRRAMPATTSRPTTSTPRSSTGSACRGPRSTTPSASSTARATTSRR